MNFLGSFGQLLRKISWIGLGVTGVLVLVLAVYLAVSAQQVDPNPVVKVAAAKAEPGPAGRRGALPSARPRGGERDEAEELATPRAKALATPADLAVKPPIKPLPAPGAMAPPSAVADLYVGPEPKGTGALGKEDLEKRRTDRRERQSDRLRTRVKTLEERIESYKKDGSRTTTQVERMQQSLDRLKERLKRMEEEEKAGGGAP